MMFSHIRIKGLLSIFVTFIAVGAYLYYASPTEAEMPINYNVCFDFNNIEVNLEDINIAIRSLDEPGDDPDKLMLRGSCYIEAKNYTLALKDVNKTIELNPEYGLAHQTRAKIYFLSGNYNKAIADLNHSIEHHLGDVDDYLLLANIYKTLEQLNNAESVLKDKLSQFHISHPDYKSGGSMVRTAYDEVLLYLALSDVLQQQNKTDESIDVLIEAVDRSNGSVQLFDALLSLLESNDSHDLIQKYKNERCHIPNIQISKYCQLK